MSLFGSSWKEDSLEEYESGFAKHKVNNDRENSLHRIVFFEEITKEEFERQYPDD